MSKVCAKHVEQPAFIYGECIGCELETLRAEAQALREEVAASQKKLAFTEQWHAVRHERLWHWAHDELSEEQKRRYFNIVANGTAEHNEPSTYAQQLCRMKHRAESAAQEVAALRARVVVVPDRRNPPRGGLGSNARGWNNCLDELARLNGKVVSEGLLRRLAEYGDDFGEAWEELRALLDEEPSANRANPA